MVDLKETKIDGRFVIGQKLGSGSFGDIFLGKSRFFFISLKFSGDRLENSHKCGDERGGGHQAGKNCNEF